MPGLRLGLIAVADAGLGQQVAWLVRVGFEFLPQVAHVDAQVVALAGVGFRSSALHHELMRMAIRETNANGVPNKRKNAVVPKERR